MTDTEKSVVPIGLELGSIIAQKYRIDRVIGSGGMGIVVKATHLELREAVAIKVLLPAVCEHPEASARFLREARAAAKLRSIHAARTTDVGTLENGQRYMVMEYLQGSDLAAILAEKGRLSVRRALSYVLQVCDALAEAHQHGIVHRDIKPANLFVVPQPDGPGVVKVLDFGVSKAIDLQSTRNVGALTCAQSMVGTPVYASPEQLLSAADVDERTDIWALGGVVLYELLTGRPPFVGDSIEELVSRVMTAEPEPLRKIRPDVPIEVERIVMTCLQKERQLRYASAPELVNAILSVSGSQLDAESQLMASRIIRRHNSSIPPAPPVPSIVEAADTAPNPGILVSAGSIRPPRTPMMSSDATKVSPQSSVAGAPSNSTNAGVYSSRPAVPGVRRTVPVRTVILAILGLVIVAGALLIVSRNFTVPTGVPSVTAASALVSAAPLPALASAAPPAITVPTQPSVVLPAQPIVITSAQAVAPDSKAPASPNVQIGGSITGPAKDNSSLLARPLQTPSKPKTPATVHSAPSDRQGNAVTTPQTDRTTVDFGPRR